ncbi:MAG: zinc-finger domain-containing protein [Rickettsiales bacterium]
MKISVAPTTPFEIIKVDHSEVACDGGTLGHPKVYLHIERETGEVTCPYCSRTFVLKNGH